MRITANMCKFSTFYIYLQSALQSAHYINHLSRTAVCSVAYYLVLMLFVNICSTTVAKILMHLCVCAVM